MTLGNISPTQFEAAQAVARNRSGKRWQPTVVANQGESAEAVRRYLDGERLVLSRVLVDPTVRLGPALASGDLPTTVFFDRHGQRVDAHMGEPNAAALATKLEALLTP